MKDFAGIDSGALRSSGHSTPISPIGNLAVLEGSGLFKVARYLLELSSTDLGPSPDHAAKLPPRLF